MEPEPFPICTQCGFTLSEARSRGLLGCPHCYTSFGEALQGDLLWMHAALDVSAFSTPPSISELHPDPENLARWRRQLAEAVKVENYTEAERLHILIEAQLHRKASEGFGLA